MTVLNHSLLHQAYFEEMTQIPHGSFHEEAYSNYLVAFAKQHGLRYIQDDMWNVMMYKDASKGREHCAPVLIQAHMDMVCEKNKDSQHNFESDPLTLRVEDDWLMANQTTLGADDGAGVAYMLAILADKDCEHPPLECAFTVQEEVGLFGAMNLKKEDIHAKRMINLDDESGYATCTTSAGGMNVILKKDITYLEEKTQGYQVMIKGLLGGHSGAEIDKERGNANQLLARVLYAIDEAAGLQLSTLEGGLQDNAIAREACASFVSKASQSHIQEIVDQLQRQFYQELEFSDAGVEVLLEEVSISQVLPIEESDDVLQLLMVLPHGLRHHSMSIEGLSTASMNVGVLRMSKKELTINCSLRGALESYIDQYASQLDILAKCFHFDTSHIARYPAWSYDANSAMRELMQTVCKELTGKDLGIMATHGGLECGVFKSLVPEMDIVTLGPIMKQIHTPQEALYLPSFDEMFLFLKSFLKALS